MASPKLIVTYPDGRKDEAVLNPRVLVEVERHFGGNIPGMEGSYWGAWFRLGRPGDNFEAWLDEVEIDMDGATAPNPT